jgi:hypothetical protein
VTEKESNTFIKDLINKGKTHDEQVAEETRRYNSERQRDYEEQTKAKIRIEQTTGATSLDRLRLQETQGAFGFRKIGLPPDILAHEEMARSLSSISDKSNIERTTAMMEMNTYWGGAEQLHKIGTPEADRPADMMKAEAQQKGIQMDKEEIDAKIQSIDAIKKFNESIERAADEVANTLTKDIVGVLMGAQKGAMHGRPGAGALTALYSAFDKQESVFLDNTVKYLLGQGGVTGQGGWLANLGNKLPDFLTKGTVLQHIDKDIPLTDNTAALKGLKAAVVGLTQRLSGGVGGGSTAIPGGSGAGTFMGLTLPSGIVTPGQGATPDINSILGPMGAPASADISSLGSGMAAAASIASAAGAGTAAAMVSSVGKDLTSLSKALLSAPGANDFKALFDPSAPEVKLAAAMSMAAAGAGMFAGVSTMAKGGARNEAGGLAEALGAAGLVAGPAAPFVESAAAVAAIVAAVLPNSQVQRAKDEANRQFAQTYLAPPSWQINQGTNAGYADVDMYGNVRTSALSPYPIVSDPYLDIPRKIVVPGHTISQFGGYSNVTGAQAPQNPVYQVNVTAMDSKSIVDRAGDIVDAVHKGIQSGYHPLINTLGQQLGIR